MSFWKRSKQESEQGLSPGDAGQVQKAKKKIKRSPPLAMEVKILAIEALESGLSAQEVGELVCVGSGTIHKWRRDYAENGVQGLCRKASSIAVRKQCSVLEEKIVALRKENPEFGVRRIRDDLRRHEGIDVSAEKVRTVVNESGLGNPPPEPRRRPPQVRRFERSCPNAMWQIDIFTFQLKRMYPVYLIGIIDDHSRYLVGWGLFRQQNAEAVLEVLKGTIGQWGAPRELLSDNGLQFGAWRGKTRFQKALRQQGRSNGSGRRSGGSISRRRSSPLSRTPAVGWSTGSTITTTSVHIRGSTAPVPRIGSTASRTTWKKRCGRVARRTHSVWPWVRSRSRRCICSASWAVRMLVWSAREKRSRSRWAMRFMR